MSLPVPVCTACGAAAFPPRLLCPRCGGRDWRVEAVERGTVEGVTEGDGVAVAEVRSPLGPVVVARLTAPAAPGEDVALDTDRIVPVATPA